MVKKLSYVNYMTCHFAYMNFKIILKSKTIYFVFGTKIWPAAECGRVMYTIWKRIGPLIMRMQNRHG